MTEPVAVVGTAALLPGSPTVARFWRNLVAGRDQGARRLHRQTR
jgi:acyl transferase domain-containing protein